jgi:3-oxoacyl-[acyl-carrier-protein] synthase I
VLAITSIGMVTAVGHDSLTSCASIRAGLSRRDSLPSVSVLGVESGEEEPVFGAPVAILTTGRVLAGRWGPLALRSLTECARNVEAGRKVDAAFWERVGLVVALPEVVHARFDSDEACGEQEVSQALLPTILESFGRPIRPENVRVICRGHAGIAAACVDAEGWIAKRRVDRVIVAGADSYLDPHSVAWLDSEDRLRTESNPAGVLPGEAGGAFMLEATEGRAAGVQPRAVLVGAKLGFESKNWGARELSHGQGLSAAAQTLLEGARATGIRTLISDVNGETWRSHELGSVRMRMRELLAEDLDVVLPAASLGDVGAASAAIAIGICAESFARRYAKADNVLVLSSSDSGDVGVLLVARP